VSVAVLCDDANRVDGQRTRGHRHRLRTKRFGVFALSDAKNGVAADEHDVAERACSAACFEPVRNSRK